MTCPIRIRAMHCCMRRAIIKYWSLVCAWTQAGCFVCRGITSFVPDWLVTSQWLKMGKQTRIRALKRKADKAKAQ